MAALSYRLILFAALITPTTQVSQAKANESLLHLLQNKRCPQCAWRMWIWCTLTARC